MMDAYDCAHWTGAVKLRWGCTKPLPRLAEMKAPALVVVGERDTPAFREMASTYAGAIPGARMVTLRGAGHCSNLEASPQFDQVVTDFLTAL
jgi:pimeloyl-ACP methyl ester carboxylesterase